MSHNTSRWSSLDKPGDLDTEGKLINIWAALINIIINY